MVPHPMKTKAKCADELGDGFFHEAPRLQLDEPAMLL
jgi:hypothetical protein